MPESPQSTRDALLDAAEDLFSAHGYDAVGIREIAERSSANIAAIKYHFGSKSELYLATVRRAMSRGDAVDVWEMLREVPADPARAAALLVRFIRLMLERLLHAPDGARCCSLMLREAAEPSEAIDAVVRDFIQPHQRLLMDVVRAIAPALSAAERSAAATSVLSQVLHYRIFRPFLHRMPECSTYASDADFIAAQIAAFSLRGLRCDERAIERALAGAALPVAARAAPTSASAP